MNCNKVKRLLPLYISDDLDESELASVDGHLGGCLNCYRDYQAHLKALRIIKQLSDKPDLSPVMEGFTEEVLDRVVHDTGGPAAAVPRMVYAYIPRTLAAAAALLLLMVGAYYVFGPSGSESLTGDNLVEMDSPEAVLDPALSGSLEGIRPLEVADENNLFTSEKLKKLPPGDENYSNTLPQRFPTVQPVGFQGDF